MRAFVLIIATAVLSCGVVTAAQEEDNLCANAVTNNELISCSGLMYERADKKLNAAYKNLLPKLNAEQSQKLKSIQRKWIAFKEAECQKAYDSIYPGNEASFEKNACLQFLTEDRELELRVIDDMLEGKSAEDRFSKTMNVLCKEGYSKERLIPKFSEIYAGDKWRSYVKTWCEFTGSYLNEDISYCAARQDFMRSY